MHACLQASHYLSAACNRRISTSFGIPGCFVLTEPEEAQRNYASGHYDEKSLSAFHVGLVNAKLSLQLVQ